MVLCEGTGHVAVGSIVDASNAHVALWLGARMLLVVNGGLGNAFDELDLNKVFCDKYGVEIAGVIINKVMPDKYEQTKYYRSKALKDNWGKDVPLLGLIPDRPFLGSQSAVETMTELHKYTPKLNFEDGHRVDTAISHYEEYIDLDLLLERLALDDHQQAGVQQQPQ